MPVIVTGVIDEKKINDTIKEGTTMPYDLGKGVSGEQIVVAIGCETDPFVKGMDFSILGAPFVFLNGIIATQKYATLVLETDILRIMNTENRENKIQAVYKPSPGRLK